MSKSLRRWYWPAAATLATAALLSFSQSDLPVSDPAQAAYRTQLQQLETGLTSFRQSALHHDSLPALQQHFVACRQQYKQAEATLTYFFPFAAHRMNGAAVLESEPGDVNEVVFPTGFQVLETYIYDVTYLQHDRLVKELDYMLFIVKQVTAQVPQTQLPAPVVYYATKLNLYRMAAQGLSGFDSPIAGLQLSEAVVTLRSSLEMLRSCGPVSPALQQAFRQAIRPLQQAHDPAGFNYAGYLSGPYRQLLLAIHTAQQQQHIGYPEVQAAVRVDAASMFEVNAFDPQFFAPEGTPLPTAAIRTLGEKLFDEKLLTQNGRTCKSCHDPTLGYADGLTSAPSLLHGENLSRNTPTLLNAALQPALFYDARTPYLETQVLEVLNNKAEMHGQLHLALEALQQDETYKRLFRDAFPADDDAITEQRLSQAIAAYVRSLVALQSRFDRFMQGQSTALNREEQQGFNLFMSKAQCGTCHYLPLMSGAVPPLFDITESEVLGVPANADTLHPIADTDRGAYVVFPKQHKDGAFRTPTLRNIARTAPYMHNGVFQTLEEVIDFYDRGGGQGLGLPITNQTLSGDRLHLTAKEKKALVAFMKALDGER